MATPSTHTLVADIQIPFFKDPILRSVPWIGIPLVALTIIGSSNAVNLTDGMDGLAIGCTLIVAMVMLILTYLSDNVKLATYLQIPHVRGASELTVVCAAFIGASSDFCGSTVTPPRSSWATPDRWPWAVHWASWLS